MGEHPYRDPAAPSEPKRAKTRAWAIAIAVVWIACAARAIAGVFDRSLAGPLTGLSIVLAVVIPLIAANARVLAEAHDD